MFKTIIPLLLMSVGMLYAQNQVPSQTSSHVSTQITLTPHFLSPRLRDALIEQVAREQYSSNLYLTFASYFADVGLDGSEKFFRNQSHEEAEHALRFYNFLIDRNEKFQLHEVTASQTIPTSTSDAFNKLLENEIKVTQSIHNLYALAVEDKDYAAQAFLFPFLLIQVEEEKQALDLVQLLQTGSNDPAFLLLFDNKLNKGEEKDD